MISASEKIAIMEVEMRNLMTDMSHLSLQIDRMDSRLRTVERSVWIGIGALGLLQFALTFWSKL